MRCGHLQPRWPLRGALVGRQPPSTTDSAAPDPRRRGPQAQPHNSVETHNSERDRRRRGRPTRAGKVQHHSRQRHACLQRVCARARVCTALHACMLKQRVGDWTRLWGCAGPRHQGWHGMYTDAGAVRSCDPKSCEARVRRRGPVRITARVSHGPQDLCREALHKRAQLPPQVSWESRWAACEWRRGPHRTSQT